MLLTGTFQEISYKNNIPLSGTESILKICLSQWHQALQPFRNIYFMAFPKRCCIAGCLLFMTMISLKKASVQWVFSMLIQLNTWSNLSLAPTLFPIQNFNQDTPTQDRTTYLSLQCIKRTQKCYLSLQAPNLIGTMPFYHVMEQQRVCRDDL